MKLASLLLFAILLYGISFQAYAIEPGDIAAPSIAPANMNMPKPIITSPNMNAPEPKQTQQDSNANQTGEIDDQTKTTKAKPDDLSGKWSIKFDDRPDRLLDLTLWSSGRTKIMGYGTLTRGSTGNSVTVSGSLDGEELILAVKPAELEFSALNSEKYDIRLFLTNTTPISTISGAYVLSFGGEFVDDGNATAIKR